MSFQSNEVASVLENKGFFKFLDEIVEIIDEEEKTQHQSKLKN